MLLDIQLNLTDQAVKQGLPGATGAPTATGDFITLVLQGILVIAALAVFIFLIWGAFEYITAGGEKGKVESARNKITGAIIGLIVLAATIPIFILMQRLLGIDVINFASDSSRTSQTPGITREAPHTQPGSGNDGSRSSQF